MQVRAGNGSLNGSALPIIVTTDAMGQAVVRYEPLPGYGGTMAAPAMDDIVFEAASLSLDCTITSQVAVATCGLELDFAAPPTQGVSVDVEVRVLYVDPATADGQTVALSATSGTLSPPAQTIGPLTGTTRQITYTPTATATGGSISLSFVDGYPCNTMTATFDVAP